MNSKVSLACISLLSLSLLASCSYNPLIPDNYGTGNPAGAVIGAGIGAGGVALLGGPKAAMGVAGLAGGAIGYYVTTLRYDSGGILQYGGKVYKIGKFVGIYIPSEKLFEPNTANFLPQSLYILESAATVLSRYPQNNIIISGNTSGFYRPRWEQKLSETRAQKISAFLWNEGINNFKTPGIDSRKLTYVGYGDYFPISQTIKNIGIRENSRIQIISYPSDCDLKLDEKHIAVHNVGGLDLDQQINRSPSSRCATTDLKGECVDSDL